MRDDVESVENLAAEKNGNQRTGRNSGEVTEDREPAIGYRDNTERRVTEKSSRLRAGLL